MNRPLNFLTFSVPFVLGMTVFFNPANQVLAQDTTETVKEHATKHTDASYVCPMHSEVRSEEAGNCPLCGMHLAQEQPVPSHDGDLGAGGEKQ